MNARPRFTGMPLLALLILATPAPAAATEEPLPYYLQDRGTGVYTSLFGTYVRDGELLVYPFYEYVVNKEDEYHGSELGYTGEIDYLGKVVEHEYLLFFAYGFTEDLAAEFESALYTTKTLERASDDTTSGLPPELKESGLGDVEGQIRWRLAKETATRPEYWVNFEVVFPLQKDKVLIGTQDWEFGAGIGLTNGFTWGTLTPRFSIAYDRAESELEVGEVAIEYLKRLSPEWRWVSTIEGTSDEFSLILEAQWHFSPRAFWKFNSGFALTEPAEDFAPEIGLMMVF